MADEEHEKFRDEVDELMVGIDTRVVNRTLDRDLLARLVEATFRDVAWETALATGVWPDLLRGPIEKVELT